MKGYIITGLVTVAVIVIAFRIAKVRAFVFGA